MNRFALIFVLSLLGISGFAASPSTAPDELSLPLIPYRGRLIDGATGKALTFPAGASKLMVFRAYDSDKPTATPLWTSRPRQVPISPDGSFEYELSDVGLVASVVTGNVAYVGVTIGAGDRMEITPRRMLLPIASVNRALLAEGVAENVAVGTLGAKTLVTENLNVLSLETRGTVIGGTSQGVNVQPLAVGARETTLVRGKDVRVLGGRTLKATVKSPVRGQALWTADSNGFVLIHTSGANRSSFRIPGVVQAVRAGDTVRAPTSEEGDVSVEFYGFATGK